MHTTSIARVTARGILPTVSLLVLLSLPGQATQAQNPRLIYVPLIGIGIGSSRPAPTDDLGIRREALRLINVERVNVGCPAATESAWLMDRAQAWSDYMRDFGYFEHSSTLSTTLYTDQGHAFATLDENISNEIPSASAVVLYSWMTSPGHRETMLFCHTDDPLTGIKASEYRYEFGIGMARRPVGGNAYWTLAIVSIWTPPTQP